MTFDPRDSEKTGKAIDSLPLEAGRPYEYVEVVLQEEPPRGMIARLPPGSTLLGLYRGVPLTERGHDARLHELGCG